ncbi:hypothetical protein B0H10DRAFT_1980669 [Mycena sp. CBHHK59/15]|nr:hypothetical protein B0H10DRAFT_1980669 [Mycena sp. CBHHK59/15]
MTSSEDEVLSELLIAQLIEEDLRLLGSAKEAERLQLDQALAVSARAKGRVPKFSGSVAASEIKDDEDIALEIYAGDARVSSDAAYAQRVQASNVADLQYAQKVAAAEKKIMLDAEFARRLQAIGDEGMDTDKVEDAESLLGRDVIDSIMVSGLNEKGKGKLRVKSEFIKVEDFSEKKGKEDVKIKKEDMDGIMEASYPECGICMDAFQPTHSPYPASLSANSSNRLPFGLRLPCPQQHAYCVHCLTSYIESKLDPEGKGGNSGIIVFPIRCPECPMTDFIDGIPDDVAERILGKERMVLWVCFRSSKLLNSIPHFYCPNPKCSAVVQAPEDTNDPQAVCPSCQLLMCAACRALPPDERSPEDRLLLELAKSLVELISGCNHMTCRCGTHFCFKCGSLATTKGQCQRDPPCQLWDEEMLLEERERERERAANLAHPGPAYHLAPVYHPAPAPPAYNNFQLAAAPAPPGALRLTGWMIPVNVVCSRHWFTTDMIRNLVCGYCDVKLNSLADLRFHLLHVRRHPVYSCCGRFFKRVQDFERHLDTYPARFYGEHVHQMRSD